MSDGLRGTEMVVSALGRWMPGDLAFIERLDLASDGHGTVVTIVALFQRRTKEPWPDLDRPLQRVTLRFDGAGNLRVDGLGGGRQQIMGFDILSIADRGWEHAMFEVTDYEDGRIGFTCASAEVVSVQDDDVVLR